MKKIFEKVRDIAFMDSQIQIIGNKEVLVDGCKKILEYDDVFVKVSTWNMIVNIWGSELTVNDFGSGEIFICGNIQSIELENR